MKILVFGVGVVGTAYAWQLSLAGHELALLVRPGRKQELERQGIALSCVVPTVDAGRSAETSAGESVGIPQRRGWHSRTSVPLRRDAKSITCCAQKRKESWTS